MSKTRQNHPDFDRPQFVAGQGVKAGDWYIGPLYTGRCPSKVERAKNGLNYFDGDEWVRLSTVDRTFEA